MALSALNLTREKLLLLPIAIGSSGATNLADSASIITFGVSDNVVRRSDDLAVSGRSTCRLDLLLHLCRLFLLLDFELGELFSDPVIKHGFFVISRNASSGPPHG